MPEEALYHPKLVELVEQNRHDEITDELCKELFGDEEMYTGGSDQLEIEWIPVGTAFEITEYDGYEYIKYATRDWLTA